MVKSHLCTPYVCVVKGSPVHLTSVWLRVISLHLMYVSLSPHGPISHYLSSFTAICILYCKLYLRPRLNSTLSLHTTSPPTHPPLNTPRTYGVIRLPTGRRAASCHITRIEWGHHKSRPQHVEWNIELEPAPNTGASHNGPVS